METIFILLDGDEMIALDAIEYMRPAYYNDGVEAPTGQPLTFIRTKSGLDVYCVKSCAEIKESILNAINDILAQG